MSKSVVLDPATAAGPARDAGGAACGSTAAATTGSRRTSLHQVPQVARRRRPRAARTASATRRASSCPAAPRRGTSCPAAPAGSNRSPRPPRSQAEKYAPAGSAANLESAQYRARAAGVGDPVRLVDRPVCRPSRHRSLRPRSGVCRARLEPRIDQAAESRQQGCDAVLEMVIRRAGVVEGEDGEHEQHDPNRHRGTIKAGRWSRRRRVRTHGHDADGRSHHLNIPDRRTGAGLAADAGDKEAGPVHHVQSHEPLRRVEERSGTVRWSRSEALVEADRATFRRRRR